MANSVHDVDWQKMGEDNLRPKHRSTNQNPFYRAFLAPLMTLRDEWKSFRESITYQLDHDSRKISIEKVLNDYFDQLDRRIYIDNVALTPQVYLYEPGDDRPVYVYEPADDKPVYLYQSSNVDLGAANFVVYLPNAIKPIIPTELRRLEVLINTQINRYKLDSKEHILLWTDL